MPIAELRVAGYRSIRELRLPLQRINVLTGPNGCGKSNLYNAVLLPAKAASGGFERYSGEPSLRLRPVDGETIVQEAEP